MLKSYKLNKIINEAKINIKEVDESVMKTLEVFRELETNNIVSTLFTE
jgi:hypothetical protein